jgi:radical SAM superfamily enzyme YgiQ (UPF0313 family)
MSDILLINPPRFDTSKLGKVDVDQHWAPPLGIAYIATVLASHNFDVKPLDLHYVPMETAKAAIQKDLGDIVGISCFSEQRASSYQLIEYIRSLSKEVLIVIGGPHGTVMYQQLLENFPIDAVILGEGEITFLELAQAYLNRKSLADVAGLALRGEQGVFLTAKRSLIENLDDLPFPDMKYFADTTYETTDSWFRGMEVNGNKIKDLKWATIAASRGCPYQCAFCSTAGIWERRWRKRSPQNVVDEIEFRYKEFGYQYVDFYDDIFTLDESWTIEICKELINRGNPIYWDCQTRVDAISEEVLKWLKRAGCIFVSYGIESFSPQILNSVNKKITKEQILKACEMSSKAEMNIELMLIVGSPGETDETVAESIELIHTVKPFEVTPSIMTIFPGTQLYEQAVKDKFISDEYWLTDKPCPYDTREHDVEVLKKWYNRLSALSANG